MLGKGKKGDAKGKRKEKGRGEMNKRHVETILANDGQPEPQDDSWGKEKLKIRGKEGSPGQRIGVYSTTLTPAEGCLNLPQ